MRDRYEEERLLFRLVLSLHFFKNKMKKKKRNKELIRIYKKMPPGGTESH